MEQNQKGSLYKKIFEYIQYKPKTEETTFVLPETEEEQCYCFFSRNICENSSGKN